MSVTPNHPTGVRARQKRATRDALLGAARDCFAERGFAGTHVAHVTARAEVAHGTFYVHFPSKRALLDALLADLNERLRAEVAAAMAAAPDRDAAVRAAARTFLSVCLDERALVRVYAERAGGGVDLDELVGGINPPALALVRRALEGQVEPAAAELAAHGLLALWLRIALRVVFAEAPVEEASAALARMTLGAVQALARGAS